MSLSAALERQLHALPPGAIAVAYSGGMDSSVLLHAMSQLPEARTRGLRAIHVDHGLHADSARWSEHCERCARALDVPITAFVASVERASGTGLEDAARTARFAVFEKQMAPGEFLALAQHRDDQAETILLKLLRGAGPEGLGGMRTLRQFAQGYLWRPLLTVPRSMLHDYAQTQDLRWLDDPSNADDSLRRNFLRREILPRLTQRWPEAGAALAHSATWARAAADFIAAQAASALAQLRGTDPTTLRWRDWLVLPEALRDPVLRLWLRELGFDEPAHFHVAELERQLGAPEDRTPYLCFAQTQLRRYRDLLYAMRPLPEIAQDWEIAWNGTPLALPGGRRLELEPTRELHPALIVRHRRGGERIKLAGAAHTRELRALLQEAGIPPWQRERLPLIYADDVLLAVCDVCETDAGVRWRAEHNVRFVVRD
jgi:tRNA(Ile)-lysidine synthase